MGDDASPHDEAKKAGMVVDDESPPEDAKGKLVVLKLERRKKGDDGDIEDGCAGGDIGDGDGGDDVGWWGWCRRETPRQTSGDGGGGDDSDDQGGKHEWR